MTTRRISRKQFLGMSALGGAGLMLARGLPAAQAAPMNFSGFRMPLPVPPLAKAGSDGVHRLSAEQFTQKLHPQLPAVKVWGYSDGTTKLYPGPTISLRRNSATQVEFTNNLPSTHLLPVDPAVAGARGTAPRILTHLHGGFVTGDNDGNPYATQDEYTKDETQSVTYPAHPRALCSGIMTMRWG